MLRLYSKCFTTSNRSAICSARLLSTTGGISWSKQDVATQPNDERHTKVERKFGPKSIKTYYLRPKKPMRSPLVKNFFGGKVDTELLTYPEVIPRDDMVNLHKNVDYAAQYFRENIDSKNILAQKNIPATVISDMAELEMFGADISHEYGGQSYGYTEMSLTSEAECKDINVATTLNAHRQAARLISTFGTEAQKNKYLPRLAAGRIILLVMLFKKNVINLFHS